MVQGKQPTTTKKPQSKKPTTTSKTTKTNSTKTSTSANKKTPAKTNANSNKRTNTKTNNQSSQVDKNTHKENKQVSAIILFLSGVLLAAIVFIQGENVWRFFHDTIFGLFGIMAFMLPLLLVYVGIKSAMESEINVKVKIIQCSILIIFLCSCIQIITQRQLSEYGFFESIQKAYINGIALNGGGFFGNLVGLPLVKACGTTGATVIIILAIVAFVIFITGATLLDVFSTVAKPVKGIKQIENHYVNKVREKSHHTDNNYNNGYSNNYNQQANIDVPLDDEDMPLHPVSSNKKVMIPEQSSGLQSSGKQSSSKSDSNYVDDKEPTKSNNFLNIFKKTKAQEKREKQQQTQPLQSKENNQEPNIDMKTGEILTPHTQVTTSRKVFDYSQYDQNVEDVQNSQDNKDNKNNIDDIFKAQNDVNNVDNLDNKEIKNQTVENNEQQTQEPTKPEDIRTTIEKEMDDIVKKANEKNAEHIKKQNSETQKMQEDFVSKIDSIVDEQSAIEVAQYKYPPVSILKPNKKIDNVDISDELKTNADLLVKTLKSFGVQTTMVGVSRGPTVTRYELKPSEGVKISKITGLADDIALNLAASGVRIEAPIPGKAAVGIEVPNKIKEMVSMREIVESDNFQKAKSKLATGLGKDISGENIMCDIAKMPHLLIAGATGSGKSVCVNTMLVSILYRSSPEEVKLILIDPKMVEFSKYSGIPHLLVPVVTDARKAAGALGWAVIEMTNRYKIFSENGVRDLESYNKFTKTREDLNPMPQIVIVIDELSDLMMAAANEVEDAICRLAQMARAAGMHLIIATQRPSVNVITGVIKANIPSRIALSVSSQIDSRTIIDTAGAEKLLGYGDMLYSPMGMSKPLRLQGGFVSQEEVERICEFIKTSSEETEYDQNIIQEIEKQAVPETPQNKSGGGGFDDKDPAFNQAVECLVEAGQGSTSFLQRKLKLGYARAARLMDDLEAKGIVGPAEGTKPRPVLITRNQWIEMSMTQSAKDE